MKAGEKTNRLIKEKSPYLLQHAHNPVNWYSWDKEAFQKARTEDKPIFLSIGYSTCHWCHVMEKESFEDREVAKILNDGYVAIKVDREERPDIDHIYMRVCQALTGHGGWPLTVIMTPLKKPFFAGTYFSKNNRQGRPGLMQILPTIQQEWQTNRQQLLEVSEKITAGIQSGFKAKKSAPLTEDILHQGFAMLEKNFDPVFGGFSEAPKFPTPHSLSFLLRYGKWTGKNQALAMVEKTLQCMHDGGIFDHLGYGFARYAVDRQWLIPHFEKMLYDNALLAIAFLETYQVSGHERYALAAQQIFTYILRNMTASTGGFFSAEDADSEGEEGKFYMWSAKEIKHILGEPMGDWFCQWYGVTEAGNFAGRNILNRIGDEDQPPDPSMSPAVWELRREKARSELFQVREKRVHPHKDDKILTGWNGLMIAALAMGFRILQQPVYLEAALKAAKFIWRQLRNDQGRLFARYRKGETAHLAYLDDYAFLVWGMLELYQADQDPRWLKKALTLQEEQNRLFWDEKDGGYFFYGKDAEKLLTPLKEIHDGATPSGNSVSAQNLLRLARLTGHEAYADHAETLFEVFADQVQDYAAGYTFYLMAFLLARTPGKEVVIVAPQTKAQLQQDLKPLARTFAPDTVFLYRLPGHEYAELTALAPFTQAMEARGNQPTFYICENFSCQSPTTDLREVKEILQA